MTVARKDAYGNNIRKWGKIRFSFPPINPQKCQQFHGQRVPKAKGCICIIDLMFPADFTPRIFNSLRRTPICGKQNILWKWILLFNLELYEILLPNYVIPHFMCLRHIWLQSIIFNCEDLGSSFVALFWSHCWEETVRIAWNSRVCCIFVEYTNIPFVLIYLWTVLFNIVSLKFAWNNSHT